MPSDRWKTIEESFHQAMQMPPSERAAYLDKVCQGDGDLRRELESLLSDNQTEGFMETPAGELFLSSLTTLEEPSWEGRKLNHYQMESLIGTGGMSRVYRARDTKLQREVAIKVLRDPPLFNRDWIKRMYREARLLAQLNHPNVASIYGIETDEDEVGLVLELVDGKTLAERIDGKPLSIAATLEIATQICLGLEAAQAKGIVHRDLKPSNIKITNDGTAKIIDFGIGTLTRKENENDTQPGHTTGGLIMGTVAYMSPEQARGLPVDLRTDIWGYGCILYEMLSGDAAFRGNGATDIIFRIATEEPDWSRIQKPEDTISLEVSRVIGKCLQKNPEFRYQSFRDIRADLASIRERMTPSYKAPHKHAVGASSEDFVLPHRFVIPLFLLAQFGYLAIYVSILRYIESIFVMLQTEWLVTAIVILSMCGIATRLYLISAVGWKHPDAGKKFAVLFPFLFVLDGFCAASPLLLIDKIGLGLSLSCAAALAYLPFAQRTLMKSIAAIQKLRP